MLLNKTFRVADPRPAFAQYMHFTFILKTILDVGELTLDFDERIDFICSRTDPWQADMSVKRPVTTSTYVSVVCKTGAFLQKVLRIYYT